MNQNNNNTYNIYTEWDFQHRTEIEEFVKQKGRNRPYFIKHKVRVIVPQDHFILQYQKYKFEFQLGYCKTPVDVVWVVHYRKGKQPFKKPFSRTN